MRAGTLVLALVLTTMTWAGCVDEATGKSGPSVGAPPPDDDTGQIVGTVTDDSIVPLAGVAVGVLQGPTTGAEATTNDAGAYVLTGLLPGSYVIVAQRLGYEAASRSVAIEAGQRTEVSFTLKPVPVAGEALQQTLRGEGYFACGAYIFGVLTWGNLHACVWDDHKPRYNFNVAKTSLRGIQLEIEWKQATALTSKKLFSYLQYKPLCDPLCSFEAQFAAQKGTNPIRHYAPMEKNLKALKEDPAPLSSMTFPAGDGAELVVVFQQRMTHWVTIFWGEPCLMTEEDQVACDYTALPDK
ncbi:MAG: carboxypeptidase regulatory-like domain-containing protein [Euryarchaeota archaeon]|nr:carboxypeptidase regulatory-like domain-containing protein [Euryarchaeota archaeon]